MGGPSVVHVKKHTFWCIPAGGTSIIVYVKTLLSYCGRPEDSVRKVVLVHCCGRPEHSVRTDFMVILWEA